jgi:hypothetical protein
MRKNDGVDRKVATEANLTLVPGDSGQCYLGLTQNHHVLSERLGYAEGSMRSNFGKTQGIDWD